MSFILKQSTASQDIVIGAFIDDTDFKTAETGLTIANTDIKLMKDGATSVDKNSGGGTHRINGFYSITLDATDTDTIGQLMISVKVAGALPVWLECQVLEETVFDLFYGSGADGKVVLQGVTHTSAVIPTVTTLTGHTAQTADHTAGIADIPTVSEFNARTIVAANYFDPAADAVANVTLCATTTTNTDVTALNDIAATDIVSAGAITTLAGAIVNVDLCDLTTTTTTATNLTTNNDKAGYALSAAGVDLIWDETMAGHVTADTSGLVMNEWQDGGRLDVILDARMAEASIDTTGGAVDLVTLTTTATTSTNLTTNNDKTGYALSTAGDQSIADLILPPTNTAFPDIEFVFVAASDHVTPVTGATGTAVTRSIDGGAFGSGTGTLAEVANGVYQYDASAADMNGKIITFRFVGTGGTPGAPDDTFVTLVTSK